MLKTSLIKTLTSRRGARRSAQRSPKAGGNAVLLYHIPSLNHFSSDSSFRVRRNLAEVLISVPTGILPTVQFMPGFSGTPWVTLGPATSDMSAAGTSIAIPLAFQFSLDALTQYVTDLATLFMEFKVVAVRFTFKTLYGQSGLVGAYGALPEMWASAWPEDGNPPPNIAAQEARVNVRKVLGPNQVLTMDIAPRPAISLYNTPVTSAYAYMPIKDLWASTATAASMPWYAGTGYIRNMSGAAGSGMGVRVEAEAFLEFRRLR
jgi:hypothetical protein